MAGLKIPGAGGIAGGISPPEVDPNAQIEYLAGKRDAGEITAAEFEAQRRRPARPEWTFWPPSAVLVRRSARDRARLLPAGGLRSDRGALARARARSRPASSPGLGAGGSGGDPAAGINWVDPLSDESLSSTWRSWCWSRSSVGRGWSLLHRPRGRGWCAALLVAMPLTIAAVALFGTGVRLGLSLGAAVVLGAIIAPTDPVLAGDIGGRPAGRRDRDTSRTSRSRASGAQRRGRTAIPLPRPVHRRGTRARAGSASGYSPTSSTRSAQQSRSGRRSATGSPRSPWPSGTATSPGPPSTPGSRSRRRWSSTASPRWPGDARVHRGSSRAESRSATTRRARVQPQRPRRG